jgi:EAL domain-containing protein (putative c-di-GMP-specific phosphodiesterase class I)
MKKWDFGQEALQVALVSAKEHLKPGMLSMQIDKGQMNEEQYVNSVRKLLKRIHPVSWRILLAISESDYRGRTLEDWIRFEYDGEYSSIWADLINNSLSEVDWYEIVKMNQE